MTGTYWLVLRDDGKKTFEVCGKATNTNAFTNRTRAMQRVGMNVSDMIPPVTNKTASKDAIKIIGYTHEEGLETRLEKIYYERLQLF